MFNKRIAEKRLKDLIEGGCVVEAGADGPTLFERAKSAVAVGMLALSVISPISSAYAADHTSLTMPTTAAATAYMNDAAANLKEQGPGMLGFNIHRIEVSDQDRPPGYTYQSKTDGLLFGGKVCVISYAKPDEMSSRYRSALEGMDLRTVGALEQMNAVSVCSVLGLMESGSLKEYKDTSIGYLPLVELVSYAATAKYQPDAAQGVYKVLNGLAFAELMSPYNSQPAGALWKLSAFQKLNDFLQSKDGAEAIAHATPKQLVNFVDIAVRTSQAEIAASNVANRTERTYFQRLINAEVDRESALDKVLNSEGLKAVNEVASLLRTAGLKDAATGVDNAVKSGVTSGEGFYADIREKTCFDKNYFSQRRQRQSDFWCSFSRSSDWAVDTLKGDDFSTQAKVFLSAEGGSQVELSAR